MKDATVGLVGDSFTLALEHLNLLEAKVADSLSFFQSGLWGETGEAELTHSEPFKPRQVRASLSYRFW